MSRQVSPIAAFPTRPSLTPVLICALVFWVLCAISYSTASGRSSSGNAFLFLLCMTLFAVSFAAIAPKRTRPFGLLVASAAIGVSLGAASAVQVQEGARLLEGFEGTVELQVEEDSVNYGFGETAIVRLQVDGAPDIRVNARLGDVGPLLAGERITGAGSFSPAEFSQDERVWQNGLSGTFKAASCTRSNSPGPLSALIRMRMRAIEAFGSDDEQGCLLQAIVCGYRRNVRNTPMYARFQTCGLAHLVAVSGAHLVIVTGLFGMLLQAFRAPRWLTIGVLVAVMGSYFIMAGMPVSALRAMVMSSLGLFSFFGRRRASSLNAVGVGVFAIIALDPQSCISASFSLSVLSTLGIVLFSPLLSAWFARRAHQGASLVGDSLALTLSAAMLSQLYACSLFSKLPLVSPLSNIACGVLFPIVCGAGLIAALAAVLIPSAAPLAMGVARWSAWSLIAASKMLSSLPFACIPIAISSSMALVISAGLAIALWLWWPRKVRDVALTALACVLAIAIALVATTDRSDRIVMLDVGQGDAILVQSNGASMLVDTGNQDAQLLEELALNHVVHLDAVLITHADDDHCGSLDALRSAVNVGCVLVAQDMINCDAETAQSLMSEAYSTAGKVVGVKVGDAFRIGAFTAHAVWPQSFREDGGNADSLCVLIEYDATSDGTVDATALMTGDAECEQLEAMMRAGLVGSVDILKVCHHGSRGGMMLADAKVLAPRIALISCGENNRYGHPAAETLDMLDEVGATVYRTDRDGEVRCTLSADGISVSCLK